MAVFHEKLKCMVESAEYDFGERRGRLHMAANNCCEMSACIRLFEALDPEVKTISTYAGGVPDTIYRRQPDGWQAALRG